MKTKILSILLVVVLVGTLLLALVGCGDETYVDPITGERKPIQKIKFLHIWSECSTEFTKIVNDFMAENPDVRIDTIVSNYSDVPSYLNSQVLSASVPDVFFYWTNQVAGYAQSDICLALDDYMSGWSDTYRNGGEAWDLGKVGGKHYSVPFRCTAEVLVYNKTLFEENDIAVPTTFQEFEAALGELRALTSSPSFAPIAVTGISGGTLTALYTAFQNFSELQLGSYLDPAYSQGLITNGDQNLTLEGKMLDKLKDWNAKGYFGQCEGKSKETSVRNFVEGNAGMLILNNNNLYLLDDAEDMELGFMAIPAPAGVDYTYITSDYDGFSVYKNTKYPEACIRFLKYLTSKDVGQYFSEATDSIMAVDGIEYKTERNREVNEAMRDCGKSMFTKNDIQYSTSNIDAKNSEDVINYILGKKKNVTGRDVAVDIYNRYKLAIADAGLSTVDPTVSYRWDADFSWLDIKE